MWKLIERLPGIGCLGVLILIALAVMVAERNQKPDGSVERPAAKRITIADYEMLREGMSYEEAARAIGQYGLELSASNVLGYRTVTYIWRNEDGSNITAIFQNDRLTSKGQFGLR